MTTLTALRAEIAGALTRLADALGETDDTPVSELSAFFAAGLSPEVQVLFDEREWWRKAGHALSQATFALDQARAYQQQTAPADRDRGSDE